MSLIYWDSMLFIYYFEGHPEYGPRVSGVLRHMEHAEIASVRARSRRPRSWPGYIGRKPGNWRHVSSGSFIRLNSVYSTSGSRRRTDTRRFEVNIESRRRTPSISPARQKPPPTYL
jgi:hypothetical protein